MTEAGNYQITFILFAGTVGMLLMASGIFLFVVSYQKRMILEKLKRQTMEVEYQRQMIQAVLQSQENERKRVSKDLHDDVGMMLMTIRVQVNSLVGKALSVPLASNIQELVDATHESVRRISWDLTPATLERFGLEQTVREMCDRLNGNNAIPITFVNNGRAVVLEKNQEILLYRIIQELVSNALRHANANQIEIRFRWEDSRLIVTIADDGMGFHFQREIDRTNGRHGLGLMNLENRATLLGAQLFFEKNSPSGTLVNLRLPLGSHEQN